jgi:hypothetical protein
MVGYQVGYSLTDGGNKHNTGMGYKSFFAATTGQYNASYGAYSLDANTTGNYNTALGASALGANTTADYNTAIGYQAGFNGTTGGINTFVGALSAGNGVVTGTHNVGNGVETLYSLTSGSSNVGVGYQALQLNTTGSSNVAIGREALEANTTASYNTAVGYQSSYSSTTGARNLTIGPFSGYALTTGSGNTFVGAYDTGAGGAGSNITTGSKNTILGKFNGNEKGLDIRTSSNNIVLSDGDGNPRVIVDSSGRLLLGTTTVHSGTNGTLYLETNAVSTRNIIALNNSDTGTSSAGIIAFYRNTSFTGGITNTNTSTAYNTSSDYRLKENVVELTSATTRLKQLEPKRFNFIADADTTVDGFLAHEVQTVVPEAVHGTHNEVDADGNPVYQGIDQSKLVPLLVATIKELEARITALENA